MKNIIVCLVLSFCFTQCKKATTSVRNNPVNVTLYNKPLDTVKAYALGKWRLQYSDGGVAYQKFKATNNAYMNLTQNRIQFGDDKGVKLDAVYVWDTIPTNPGNMFLIQYDGQINLSVVQIQNDTLVIREYVDDGYFYHYTKF